MDTAVQSVYGGPKPKDWVSPTDDDPVRRRKPRTFATVNLGEIRPDPWPLDFCCWLQSEEFGNNRRHILQLTGARWIGEDEVPTDGTLSSGVTSWLKRKIGLPAQ